jgi:polysaccharide biosynthesis protein PslG
MDLRVLGRAWILIALAVGALAGAVPTPAVAAGPGRAFFGMQTWALPNAEDVAMLKRGGVGTLRVSFGGSLEESSDSERWAPYDALMAAAARQGIQVVPVLLGVAKKARPRRRLRVERPRTPVERTAWARFVTAVATRYGRGGTFWKAHPELEPRPLTAYQVWNEPNLPAYWYPANDAAGYLRLVRLTRARLLAVDPRALIVLAGLPNSRLGTPMVDYVRAIYARPGARTLFDIVALHPYAEDAPGVLGALNRVRAQMDRVGDRRTPIWVTEVGWATGGPPSPFRTSRAGQAARVARTFRALIAARRRLRLTRLVLFGLQDRAYRPNEAPWWGPRVGLFDVAGHPKPAWRTFVGFTGGRPGGRLPRAHE